MPSLSIADVIERFPDFRVALVVAEDLRIGAARSAALAAEIAAIEQACRKRWNGTELSEIPGVGENTSKEWIEEAIRLLDRFRAFVDEIKPDVTVEMGDRISDTDAAMDRQFAKEIGAALRKIPGEVHHLVGNHDLAELSLSENEDALQCSLLSNSLDKNGRHLVFWNTNPKLDIEKGFALAPEDLDWLRQDLAATSLPTVIFTHLPLDNGSMKGNFYFEKVYPHHAGYPEYQGEALRDVIERSGKVILCMNGHAHWNAYHCIDGIHYVTIPSLIETCTTWPNANEAYVRLFIGDTIDIDVHGRTPTSYRLQIKKPDTHWVNIDKDYAPKATNPM